MKHHHLPIDKEVALALMEDIIIYQRHHRPEKILYTMSYV